MRSFTTALFLSTSVFVAACGGTTVDQNQSSSGDMMPPPACSDPACLDRPEAVSVDGKGNAFVVAQPLDDGGAVFSLTKFDPTGKKLWRRLYGEGAFAQEYQLSTAVDSKGRVVVAGEFTGTGNFAGAKLTSAGSGDAFAVVLDGDGDLVWSRTFGTAETVWETSGPNGMLGGYVHVPAGATDVAFDPSGNVVLTGAFQQHVDFGKGALDAADGDNFVVALAAADGASLWTRQLVTSGLRYVTVDPSGDVILAASGPSADKSSSDILITKLGAGGATTWSKSFPAGGGAASSVKADASGNIALVGTFDLTAPDFGGGPVQNEGTFNVFVASLSPDGDPRWSGAVHGPGFIANALLAVDAAGQTVVAAECEGSASYGAVSVASKASRDVCILRIDPKGAAVSASLFSSPVGDTLSGVALNPAGDPVVVGVSSDLYGDSMDPPKGFVSTVTK